MKKLEDKLPQFLIEELNKQYGEEVTKEILNGYMESRVVSLRVNTLKTTIDEVCSKLKKENIEFEKVSWSDTALVITNSTEEKIKKLSIYEEGEIYLQSLSSMLPPVIMEPKESTDILDMTAAPGGKTTQIAALTNNNANITACEMNNIRIEKLKYNIEKQGAVSVSILQADSRNLNDYFKFDQILLDAPCSGSGTIDLNDEKTYKNFTEGLVEKSTKSQVALLKKALNILKPGHEMIYSTCSILQKENEDVLNKALKGVNAQIVPIELEGVEDIPLLPTKIPGTLCVCPNKYYEGFFVAKIRKINNQLY